MFGMSFLAQKSINVRICVSTTMSSANFLYIPESKKSASALARVEERLRPPPCASRLGAVARKEQKPDLFCEGLTPK